MKTKPRKEKEERSETSGDRVEQRNKDKTEEDTKTE